ncbi:hypothetical protein [Tautonia plasticadhaerens]|uniref:Uncharacterized protein n=1 Tax=Tautonia plasticadhaerens TaxID=2527974 RepID=A0A518GZ89_9BACT|nr:hypothetical protein [Tautonia plasticadhaerens]QDV33862.1 hypothetical protein ElP_17420 [Tautonia plasticadhaerens]
MGRWASEMGEGVPNLLAQAMDRGGGGSGWGWLADPRTAVLFVLGSAVLIGGGRRLLSASKARKAADRLAAPGVSPAEVLDAAGHGRAGLIELFRLLSEGKTPEVREAAGRALAVIWGRDDLIPEEEKAVVARGFDVRWRARRRYPRAMRAPIPIEVRYGLPFLIGGGPGIGPDDLEWSHRIAGAERAALELPSDWKAGVGVASFTLDPADFPGNGPHRLVLKATARTGPRLTSRWEVAPPQAPFSFEFDPRLDADALFTLPDEGKRAALASAIRLDDAMPEDDSALFLDLPGPFVMRDPPAIWLDVPLASDLAHRIELEFEGIPGRFAAGRVVFSGQDQAPGVVEIPIGPVDGLPPDAFDRPGEHRLRAVLVPDADLGWADPDVRSLWPEPIETDWMPVRLIRR